MWIEHATNIVIGGWADFKFLFFGPDGYLYGALENGPFLKAPPPTRGSDNWTPCWSEIGTAGWADFKFLF